MFWDSMVGGLKVFTYWQTYVASFGYFLIFMIPWVFGVLVIRLQTPRASQFGGRAVLWASAVFMPLVQVVAHVMAHSVLILTLWPIIFGLGPDAAWEFPLRLVSQEPSVFFKLLVALTVASIILSIIPFLGKIQALHTLLLGGITLALVIAILESIYPGVSTHKINYWPGFWFIAGLVVISAIASWIGMLISFYVAEAVAEGWGFVALPIAAIFGFIPIFMYGAWLGAQLKGVQ